MPEHRNHSGRLTFDFPGIPSAKYGSVTSSSVEKFALVPAGPKTDGLDEVFQDFKLDSAVVGLEWDNWSGYIVVAKSKNAEPLAKEIAAYVRAHFDS